MADSIKRILDSISSPADLKLLDFEELDILAQEIREQIISTTSVTGGHVASSLGAVEAIIAIHKVIDCPTDKVVFDVGHQSYAHKLLTGRLNRFDTLRQIGGLSGFPRPSESVYDAHPSGHASDSLSVAAGFAQAKVLNGTDERIVALIGDASLAGGMAFEALNYIGSKRLPMVIILNDNEMSISHNVGALMKHLGNIRATSQYRDSREAIQEKLESGGRITNAIAEFGKRTKDSMKHLFLPQSMIYENLGIVCTAPIDGHNIKELAQTLELVLSMDEPVLMHVVTKKGAGYVHAEEDPERFHGLGPYDIETGKSKAKKGETPRFMDTFGSALVEEAAEDQDIVAITAAMESGTGLKEFHRLFPDRFIDVGIAEENAVGMASGLAAAGKKPVVAIYSTFLQRALDQMIVDVALPSHDVVFAIDRAGIVGDDGPTHHGVFDIAYTRMIPNMRVLVPSDAQELIDALHTALALEGPVAIRYPRGTSDISPYRRPELLEIGRSRVLRSGKDVSILAFGRMAYAALEAAEILAEEGIDARVVDMRWAKPIDEEAVRSALGTRAIVTVEEGVLNGGAGEAVLEIAERIQDDGNAPRIAIKCMGVPDEFVLQGETEGLLDSIGLNAKGIAQASKDLLS